MSSSPARLGRYELLGQLATGGMAEIHLARLAGEAGFEKTVVVKRLLPELVASKAFVAMFLDEGKLVARIDHPNVCEVHELGREDSEYFLVMPYLDGVPATDFIARPREPDRLAQLRVAAGIIVQACAGLHHAHELRGTDGQSLGLVHRDVSPSNLFVTTAGVVKVLDFGVAKVRGAAAETEAGTIKGKTQYMAPEQLLGEELDRRCDVFALGIVLYELATHQRLFKRASDFLAAKAILDDTIPRADAADPAVPAPLADVIARALARKRDDRYASARDLAKAIEGAITIATPSEISDALGEWHGNELSALRTRQRRVIEVARSVQALGSGVATAPYAHPQVPGPPPVHSHAGPAPAHSAIGVGSPQGTAAAAFEQSKLLTPPPAQPHLLNAPAPRTTIRRLVPAILAGLGGLGLIFFFATRKSPFASPHHRDAAVDQQDIASRDAAVETESPSDAGTAADIPADAPVANDEPRPAAKPGFVSIDSTPFATIFVDGKQLGVTPLVKKSLSAGRHRVHAVLKDGRSKDVKVDIPAGRLAPPVVLTW